MDSFERVEITSAVELHAWLEAHHAQTESIWLVTYKKHTGHRYVPHDEILDELISFGWIDGAQRKLDTERVMQLVGPRRTQHWAKT